MGLIHTDHMVHRSTQRGINNHKVDLVLKHGKVVIHKGREVYLLRDRDIRGLLKSRMIDTQEADKLRNLMVIANDYIIITAYRTDQEKQRRILHM